LVSYSPSSKATTTDSKGTTLFVRPTSLPYINDAAATQAEKNVTLSTGPMTVGMMDPRQTSTSGSHEILDSYIIQH
jgi:hypothetical protein